MPMIELKKSPRKQIHSRRLAQPNVYLISILADAFFASASSLLFSSIKQQRIHTLAHTAVRKPPLNVF